MSTYLWKFTVRHIFGFYYWPQRLLRQLLTLLGGHLADRLRPSNKSMVYSNTESKVVSSYSIMQDKKQVHPLKTLSVSQIVASTLLMTTSFWNDCMMESSLRCWSSIVDDQLGVRFTMWMSFPILKYRTVLLKTDHQHCWSQWSLSLKLQLESKTLYLGW